MGSLEDEGDKGTAVTLVEHHVPTAVPVSGGHGTETRGDAPKSRKRAIGEDATHKREAKRARLPHPLKASLAS